MDVICTPRDWTPQLVSNITNTSVYINNSTSYYANESFIKSGIIASEQHAETNNFTRFFSETYKPSLSENIEAVIYTKIILIVAIFGVFGNVLNLAVLTRKAFTSVMERMEISAHIGLISLAISDCLYSVVLIPKSFIHQPDFTLHRAITFYVVYQSYGDAIINIFQMSSTWLTVSIAVSRYLAVCHPFKARMFIGRTSAKVSVIVAYLAALFFNIPRFWEYTIAHMHCKEGYVTYYVVPGFLRNQKQSRHVYLWFYFTLNILIPIVVLGFCNINLVRQVRGLNANDPYRKFKNWRSKQKSTDTLTLTLALIVIFYILLVTPAEVTNFILLIVDFEPHQLTTGFNLSLAVLNFLQTLNFAINFILYCSVHSRFRQVVAQIICLREISSDANSVGGRNDTVETKQMSIMMSTKGPSNNHYTDSV